MITTPPVRHVVIVGCSARKLATTTPVEALNLYQGWCVPQLRAHIGGHRQRREQILVLSGHHGLIHADTPLLPYDQPLTPHRVAELRPQVHRAWVQQARRATVGELLLLLEPTYLELIGPSLISCPPTAAHWIPDPIRMWEHATAVMDGWGWRRSPGVEAEDRSLRGCPACST
ncbi:MAG: DUF6884 domain-containing protein, partial [Pseudonocardiaceae bacterium]